jgi:hypothetical protein
MTKPVAPDDTHTRLHQVRETTKMMDKDVRLQQMRLDPPGGDHQQPCDCNICFLWADVSRLQQENARLQADHQEALNRLAKQDARFEHLAGLAEEWTRA